ncbi:hypothetical protein JXA56_02985 [Candidatus Micrarchaeota archaeon]|nr:hypothetical protein [Candidatus Micrarchaeota archaeon]
MSGRNNNRALEESARYMSSVRPPPMKMKKPEPERIISNHQTVSFPNCSMAYPKKEEVALLVVIEHFADIRRAQMNGTVAEIYSADDVLSAIRKLTVPEKKQIRNYLEKLASMSPYQEVRKELEAVTY